MDLGTLNFLIGGDNSLFKKAMDECRKQALDVQNAINGIKMPTESSDYKGKEGSINSYIVSLKRLTEQYKNLDIAERNSTKGSGLLGGDNSSISGMKREIKDLTRQYELLTDAERASSKGVDMSSRIVSLKSEKDALEKGLKPAIESTNGALDKHFGLLSYIIRRAVSYIAIWQAQKIAMNLITITGEFEKQKVALEAMFRNAAAADKIYEQIKQFSVISPFNFKDLMAQTKQLAAFSVPANQLFGTIKELGDIAAGTGVEMSRLILAYGEVNTQTFLNGRQLRQFTTAGVPLVEALSQEFEKLTGKAVGTSEIYEKISKKQVSFQMVKDAIKGMTQEGGIFYNQQIKQSETLSGKLSNLKDKFDILFSTIGENHADALKGSIDAIAYMAKHWQATWEIIKSIIAAVGIYKTTMFVINTLKKQELATTVALGIAEKENAATASAGSAAAVGAGALSGLATFGIGAAITGISLLAGTMSAYAADKKQYFEETSNSIAQIDKETAANQDLFDKLKSLSSATNDDTSAQSKRNDIIAKLAQTEPELADNIKNHVNSLKDLTKAQEEYNAIQDAKKTVTYVMRDKSQGDSIESNFNDLSDSTARLEMRNIALQDSYSKVANAIKEYKKEGKDTTGGMFSGISNENINKAFNITQSSQSVYEKMMSLQGVIGDVGNKTENLDRKTGSLINTSLLWSSLVGESLSQYNSELKTNKDLISVTNSDLWTLVRLFKSEVSNMGIKVNSKEGKEAIKQLIDSITSLDAKTKKTLYLHFGITWGDKDPVEELSAWQKQLQDAFGKNFIQIHMSDDMSTVISNIQKNYKELKSKIENEKPIIVKFGIDTNVPLPELQKQVTSKVGATSPLFPTVWNAAKDVKSDTEEMKKATNAANQLSIPLDKIKEKKAKTNVEDKYTKNLQQEKKYIDEVRESYNKLTKDMSSEAAVSQLKKMGLLVGNMTKNLLPTGDVDTGYEKYLDNLIVKMNARLKIKGLNKQAINSAILDVKKSLQEVKISDITKPIENKISDIEKELSSYKTQFNLYQQILGITGDKSTALKAAFGDAGSPASMIDYYKLEINKALKTSKQKISVDELLGYSPSQMKELGISSDIQNMVSELHNTIDENKQTELTDVLNFIKENESLQEKIDDITKKANLLREKAKNQGQYTPKFEADLNDWINKQVVQLNSTALQTSSIYEKLFGDRSKDSYNQLMEAKKIATQISSNAKINYDKDNKATGFVSSFLNGNGGKEEIKGTISDLNRIKELIDKLTSEEISKNPFASLASSFKDIFSGKFKGEELTDKLKDFGRAAASSAQHVGAMASKASTMFDALGQGKMAQAMSTVSDVMGSVHNIGEGFAEGDVVGGIESAAGEAIGWVTKLAQAHDNKLNKAIENSKERVKELQNAYTDLGREIKRTLGYATSSQYSAQLSNYKSQLAEVESQLADEEDKKKPSKSAIADYNEEIAVLEDKITYFAQDWAESEYGIKIEDWASQIGDALTNAFASGESAANAFNSTVESIMKNLVQNVITEAVIAPAMKKLQDYLFGDNGLLSNGGSLSTTDLDEIMSYLLGVEDSIGDAQKIWDSISEYASENGINLNSTTGTGITASEQSLTENTGNILASYINNIRSDTAVLNVKIDNILSMMQVNTVSYGQMVTYLNEIANNTSKIMDNTERIQDIYNIIKNGTTASSGTKFYTN